MQSLEHQPNCFQTSKHPRKLCPTSKKSVNTASKKQQLSDRFFKSVKHQRKPNPISRNCAPDLKFMIKLLLYRSACFDGKFSNHEVTGSHIPQALSNGIILNLLRIPLLKSEEKTRLPPTHTSPRSQQTHTRKPPRPSLTLHRPSLTLFDLLVILTDFGTRPAKWYGAAGSSTSISARNSTFHSRARRCATAARATAQHTKRTFWRAHIVTGRECGALSRTSTVNRWAAFGSS